ncbi:MAG: BamA/TamA family outer membrane protein [bacterium]|nr:BamA/TamA family outer membrane protein [bacterium]
MEHLFKYIPIPMYSYSSEGGNLVGLAKFNAFQLSKKDTISKPSIVSGVASITSKGRINASLATQLVFNKDRTIIMGYFNYKKQPEYLTKIGNTIYRNKEGKVDSIEEITYERLKFGATGLFLAAKHLYAGAAFEYASYFDIVDTGANNFLTRYDAQGLKGGTDVGAGFAGAFDSRDNRYTPSKGGFVLSTLIFYPQFLGSSYQFTKFMLDARKYYRPWYKHVIALQATTNYSNRDVPFYNLSLLGGDNKMRGYYQGALRDKVLVDAQVEYRMPVYKIFGLTAWAGAGRTAPDYNSLSLNGFHWSFGGGFRVRVDTKNNINMRVDFGFGPHGIAGTYINFSEAF